MAIPQPAVVESLSTIQETLTASTDAATSTDGITSTSKLALLAKAGKTDMLLLALLAGEFGPQITQGLAHVPGCG